MSRLSARFLLCGAALLASVSASATLTPPQAAKFKSAIDAQVRGDFRPVSAAGLQDAPIAEKLVSWDRLRRSNYPATFYELSDFLRANPGWPGEMELRRRAEAAIDDLTPMPSRLAYFRKFPPLSGSAAFRYAEALRAAGLPKEADAEARQVWRSGQLTGALEPKLLAEFGGIFTREDHVARADALLWSGQTDAATRMLNFLTGPDKALVEARLWLKRAAALTGREQDEAAASATKAIALVPNVLQWDPGLIADRCAYLRNSGNSMEARKLVAQASILPGSAGDANAWMSELLSLAQAAVNDGQYEVAYEIARDHGGLAFDRPLTTYSDTERDTFTSLEWLAGWVALNNLDKPRDAVAHFRNFADAAKFAQTRARGLYWAGRAADAAKLDEDAKGYFEAAARFPLTFYGQLAFEQLGRPVALPPRTDPVVSAADRQAFNKNPLVEAARIFGQVGDRGRQSQFLRVLADDARTQPQEYLVSELATQLGRTDYALIASRGEMAEGPPAILRFAYPQLPLSSELRHNWTMIHAITRQESRFDRTAVSPAGALGLMQLMPATARETAGKVGTAYRVTGLTNDPDYNLLLGSAYFSNLLDAWGGNHVLSVASYNAGAGNVRRWIRENGDPRMPGVDVVEWIESIPIYETRNYVKRVLANAVVYEHLQPQRAEMPSTNTLSAFLGKNRPG